MIKSVVTVANNVVKYNNNLIADYLAFLALKLFKVELKK